LATERNHTEINFKGWTLVSTKNPVAVMAVVSDVIGSRYTHAEIDNLMERAGIELNSPPGKNRQVKTRAWLQSANQTSSDPLATLGKMLIEFMEIPFWSPSRDADVYEPLRERIRKALADYGLAYVKGGYITKVGATLVTKTLGDIISARDLSGLQTEFNRIHENEESDPAAAVTASCALLESLFKTYIEEGNLPMPAEQSIRPLWKVIRADLRLDPAATNDDDLRTTLTGLAAIVEGTGSLRTHKGSAHGRGKTIYKLKPRHARLASHAAFTLASFVLEAWQERDV
jgi:Abortive infection C-terminus